MSHSLATSSLLTAVGVRPGAEAAAGATAAVKWITKDGIGAFGRLLVRSDAACWLLLRASADLMGDGASRNLNLTLSSIYHSI